MLVKKLHHVAYRCKDAQLTTDFYSNLLGMPMWHAITAERAHGKDSPFLHLFFLLEDGSSLAFFELPEEPEQGKDPNSPEWVQHIAFEVADLETLHATQRRLEEQGIQVLGPKIGNSTSESIYFFDPSGHRLELCVNRGLDPVTHAERAAAILKDWNARKKARATAQQ